MELRVLEYFLAVAREQSIMGAADYLNITQPTLSRQLHDLENELGKKLFIRGKRNRKITLTEEGVLFRKRAQEIIYLAERAKNEMRQSDKKISGDIYIGAGETDTMSHIVAIIQGIREKYPDVHLHVVSGNSEDLLPRLDAGLFDFCLLIGNINQSKYDFLNLPWQDEWGVLMRRDSPLAQKETIAPEDLWNEPLIVSYGVLDSPQFFKSMKKTREELNIIATYNLAYNASIMAKMGMGYVLVLNKIINTEGSNLCYRPLQSFPSAGMSLVWKKYTVFSKAAGYFLEQIQEITHSGTYQ